MKPSVDFLRECFEYDRESGILTWKHRPIEHFNNRRTWQACNTRWAGKVAGNINKSLGYVQVGLMLDKKKRDYNVHRIAWAMTTGTWPEKEIDHRNGNRADNRIANLRPATRAENHQNLSIHGNSSSGIVGISWCKQTHKWNAHIKVNQQKKNLGRFNTIAEAHTAYLVAKAKFHPFQPIPRGINA